jgi:hypothetical protein
MLAPDLDWHVQGILAVFKNKNNDYSHVSGAITNKLQIFAVHLTILRVYLFPS